jgi:hypothetical protein
MRGRLGLFATATLTYLALNTGSSIAKRTPPPDVPPVVYEGVRYEAPPFSNDCGQNGGSVVAYDSATDAQLWTLQVYCTQYDPNLETDVQDVFITSLEIENGRLSVVNEKGLHYTIDLKTHDVTGDARGCGQAAQRRPTRGCS